MRLVDLSIAGLEGKVLFLVELVRSQVIPKYKDNFWHLRFQIIALRNKNYSKVVFFVISFRISWLHVRKCIWQFWNLDVMSLWNEICWSRRHIWHVSEWVVTLIIVNEKQFNWLSNDKVSPLLFHLFILVTAFCY